MPFARPVLQQAGAPFWRLAGSVAVQTDLLPTSRSLTLVRPADKFSSYLKFAMNANSVVPVLELNTPNGLATISNARVVSVAPLPSGPKRKGHPGYTTHELEQIEFTFQKITFTNNGGNKSSQDDWNWPP